MFASKLHRESFHPLLSCHQPRRVNSSKKTSHTSGSQSQFRIFTFLRRDNVPFLYSVGVICSNDGETSSLMLPCSGLLKFFLPTSDLSFHYVSCFSSFPSHPFVGILGLLPRPACVYTRICVRVSHAGALCQQRTCRFLHLAPASLA